MREAGLESWRERRGGDGDERTESGDNAAVG